VLAAALPKALRLGAAAAALSTRWVASPAGRAAAADGEPRRAPQQRRVLLQVMHNESCSARDIAALFPGARAALRALARRGWIAALEEGRTRPAPRTAPTAQGFALNEEQHAAVATVGASLQQFGAYLLHGLTGSGKTEVYLQVIEQRCSRRDVGALVLVPEIGLTPQLVQRFAQRLAAPLAVLHSGLTDTEAAGSLARRPPVARRASSSVRARPCSRRRRRSAVIIVDEEHDASLKQHEGGFHYSARDLALVRAQRAAGAGGAGLGHAVVLKRSAERRERTLPAAGELPRRAARRRRRAWGSSICA
jgi:primosomal protein N' (replication factor Y)